MSWADFKYSKCLFHWMHSMTVGGLSTSRVVASSGESKVGARDAPPPGPNSFIFMQFSAKKLG